MTFWPPSLVQEIASKRCLVFLGAGASSGCTNDRGERPPGWKRFLELARDRYLTSGSKDSEATTELISAGQYLDAAEVLFSSVSPADFSMFVKEQFDKPKFKPSGAYESIRALDAKIVVTTNYDQIYEKVCGWDAGYSVKRYNDDDILDDIRSPTPVIIKAHGCVKSAHGIVLTRSQYFVAKKQYPRFYMLLDSIFVTHTILFLGCSLTDPDIQLVLENSHIAVPSRHPHYALVPSGRHPALVTALARAYNIHLLEYDNASGDHSQFSTRLQELESLVEDYRRLPVAAPAP